VDLDYPIELHNHEIDLPLAPETITVTNDMLFPHFLIQRKKMSLKVKPSNVSNKLVAHLNLIFLKYYLSHGLKLTKIHCVLAYSHSAWLKPSLTLTHKNAR
jgi:hypothetical protein